MSRFGYDTFSRVVALTEIPADTHLAAQLGIDAATPIMRIERVRYLNQESISLDISYVPFRVSGRLVRADLERRDLIEVMENECALALDTAQIHVEAQLCDKALGERLEIGEGAAILQIERRINDETGATVLYENLFYRGDAFRYGFSVARSSNK